MPNADDIQVDGFGEKPWKLKAKVDCLRCGGEGDDYMTGNICTDCKGTGKVVQEVPPTDIETFLERPEKAEFICVCGKKEIILRPTLKQIPHGWLNWNGDFVCSKCKHLVILAAVVAADQKVQQLKEKK